MKRIAFLIGCLALAVILGWAGALKAIDPTAFAGSIRGFNLVPWPAATALALYLPWLELITAAALLVPRWRSGALLISAGLFLVFTVIWAITWTRGIDVACGCFGDAGRTNAAFAFARSLGLLVATGWLWREAGAAPLAAGTPTCSDVQR